ncbi:MAG: hypothetical protein JNL32_10245 [Candidatus Kapabacteria bacterium]|nr:hypothetical protein [Candidatus Kapabacteria bacterium]
MKHLSKRFTAFAINTLSIVLMTVLCSTQLAAQGTTSHQSLRLVNPASPTNGITLQPPSGLTPYSLTLPSLQGAATTLLLNDGTGNLTWVTVPSLLSSTGWALTGNSTLTSWNGLTGSFIGTTSQQPLSIATTNATAQDIRFYTGANGANERMRILGTGNVGIGTTTPTATFHVNGTSRLSGGNLLIDTSAASTAGQLQLMNPARTFQTNIQAGAQTANITYTLPTTAPTAGQVLSSDASGNMVWATTLTGTTGWQLAGNTPAVSWNGSSGSFLGTTNTQPLSIATTNATGQDIRFYTGAGGANERMRIVGSNGRVGIGTTTPGSILHIVGGGVIASTTTDPANPLSNSYNDFAAANGIFESVGIRIVNTSPVAANNVALIGFNSYNAGGASWGMGSIQNSTTWTDNDFFIGYSNGGTYLKRFYFRNNGSLGIGTTTPTNTIDVAGRGAIGAGYAGIATAPSNGLIVQGNVGIGTIAPTTTFHVNGTSRFSGGNLLIDTSASSTAGQLQLMNPARTFQTNIRAGAQTANITYTLPTTAPTAGQVLSSDASGNMSWTAASSGTVTGTGISTAVAYWTSSTALGANSNYIWDNTNQRLGIWSSSPVARLHVGGRIMAVIGTDNTFLSGGNESVSGTLNTGLGYASLNSVTSGGSNVAVGRNALATLSTTSNNTVVGTNGLSSATGSNNIALGYQAGDALTSGSNNIIIGYDIDAPSAGGSNQLVIGNLIYGTGINGTGTTLSSGNIGIGVNTPLHRLHVSGGDLFVSNGGTSYFRTSGTESDISYNGGSDGLMAFDNDATNGMTAFRNNSDQIIATFENANRFVGIGTDWTTPVARLEVKNGTVALTNSNNSSQELRLYEPSGSGTNYTAFKAQAQAADITYSLPGTLPPVSGYVMTSTTSGNLSWTSPWSLGDAIRFVRKSADESITGTTLQDDDHLSLSVDANEVWEIDGVLNMDCSSTTQGGIQVALNAPAGATLNVHVFILAGFNTSTTDEIRLLLDTPGTPQGWSQVKSNNAVYLKGIITTSSTAGQLLLRWALNNSGATTTLKQNSYIKLMRIQ